VNDAALLAALPHFAYGFVLLLARFGALVMLSPGLGEAEIPIVMRAALAVSLCVLLLPVMGGAMPPPPDSPLRFTAVLGAELLTGAWFGWLARLVALALPAAAQFGSLMIGLSNVIVPDPSGPQVSALSRLFGLVPPLLLLSTGLYMVPISALVASYHLIPVGTLLPAGDAVQVVVHGVAVSFALSVRLAAPFILAGTVWQIALGVVARMVPSLQIYLLALPGQVLGGLLLLAVALPTLLAAWVASARVGLVPLMGG
jgi:flagellar biosynthetic protein FliR